MLNPITKIEKNILDYLKVINPHKYERVQIQSNLVDIMGVMIITIYVNSYEDSWPYHTTKGISKSALSLIKDDMENMFPYVFKVFCRVDVSKN